MPEMKKVANAGLLTRYLNGEVPVEQLEERIRLEDGKIHAWVEVKRETNDTDGPLRGVPYGVKDIVEVTGYHTTFGSPVYAGRISRRDAALVELLRAKGACVMGKTQTTAFAYFDPAPTRNPRNPAHTPGGSSSGSAAAVALGMVPFAIGSQTQGSIIRPASYCAVTGFKPTFGALPLNGFMPFAPSLDTAGFFTQTALDMRTLWQAIGRSVEADLPEVYGMIEFIVEPEMQEMFRHTVQTLSHYGCKVKRVTTPPSWELLKDAVPLIQTYEGARTQEARYREYGNAIGAKLSQLVREGLAMPEDNYRMALRVVEQARQDMAELFQTFPVILSAAAPGPPPLGLASTGDPRCNAPWTGLHVPAISIPMSVGEQLPMGLQMTAGMHQDALLIATATHCQALLNAGSQ